MSNNTISSTVTFPKEMIINSNLNKEQLELLKSQYQRIQKLAKEELNDNQYQLFLNKNKEVINNTYKGFFNTKTIYKLKDE